MVRYMCLINFTVQGIQGIQNSPKRASGFAAQVEQAGGRVVCQYWSLGDVDGCFIFETPNEHIAAQLLIRLEREGNVRTRSLRLFDEHEFGSIVSQL
jgi:uncharacterized protein with GYD domain